MVLSRVSGNGRHWGGRQREARAARVCEGRRSPPVLGEPLGIWAVEERRGDSGGTRVARRQVFSHNLGPVFPVRRCSLLPPFAGLA